MAEPVGPSPIAIVGLQGGEWFGRAAGAALAAADVVIGSARHLNLLPADLPGERVALTTPVSAVLDLAEARQRAGDRVCVLASGDPGFFGLARLAAARFPVTVFPAPSSVALAFARIGVNWDDAVVVSAHGRALGHAVETVLRRPKVAVLTSPEQPPEALGKELLAARCGVRAVTVCSHLGAPAETVVHGDVQDLATGTFPALSVVLLRAAAEPAGDGPGWAWGLPDDTFPHREGMITKAEVRAVALGKLALPAAGVLWDVGAGSGSVALECARLAPSLRVYAVERSPGEIDRLRRHTAIHVVAGAAPAALADLPDPDRAFIGGGGVPVLDAVLDRLRPGGVVVATFAALDRAAAGARRLGNLVQVAVSRGMPVGDRGALRLAAENPVFVCWGPNP